MVVIRLLGYEQWQLGDSVVCDPPSRVQFVRRSLAVRFLSGIRDMKWTVGYDIVRMQSDCGELERMIMIGS
jgi:hypothetical protein